MSETTIDATTNNDNENATITTIVIGDCFDFIKFNTLFNDDIFRLVLSYLNICDLGRLERASKTLRICQLCGEDSELWNKHYKKKVVELFDFVNQCNIQFENSLSSYLDKGSEFKKNIAEAIAEFNSIVKKHSEMKMKPIEEEAKNVCIRSGVKFETKEELLKRDLSQSLVDEYYNPTKEDECIKIMALGDVNAGKSSLITTLKQGHLPEDYIPNTVETYLSSFTLGKNTFRISFRDAIDEEEDNWRCRRYPQADVFLAMYSCLNQDYWSLHNLLYKWIPEVRLYYPEAAIVLVATQIDIRNMSLIERQEKLWQKDLITPISREQGERVAELSGCFTYTETSSILQIGISDLIELSIKAHFKNKSLTKPKKKKCCLQ